MKDIKNPRYYHLNANLAITLARDDRRGTKEVISWIDSCLNAQPEAEVTISNATGYLSWADFLDAPIFGEEHPDYVSTVNLINKVDAWLMLDRKALISELIRHEYEVERLRRARAGTAA